MPDDTSDFAPIGEQKTDKEKIAKFKQWFRQSHDATERWRELAIESRQFVANQQWSQADIDRLHSQRRPRLTINKILAAILFKSGMQRQQRTKVKLLPFEGGDSRMAELMGALLEYVGNCSRERKIDSQVFTDMIVTGLGFWKVILDFDDDPEGDIKWERIDPLAVFWDPNCFDAGWEKAEYVIHASWWSLEAAQAQWPEHKEEIRKQFGEWLGGESASGSGYGNLAAGGEMAGDSNAPQRLWWDKGTQKIRVIEVWYTKRTKVTVVFNTLTKDTTADEEAVKIAREEVKKNPELKDTLKFYPRSVKTIHVAQVLNDIMLDNAESPYTPNVFPIFPTVGYYFWKEPLGDVEYMKDPQREKNKRRSTMVEMVQRMPHSGFFNKMVGGAKTKDLEEFATGNGAVVNYQDVPPEPIRSPDLPQTLVFLDAKSDAEVRDVVNVTNELLGNNTQRTVSGRAIEARQRSGGITQEPMLDSFEEAKEPAVKFLIGVIQQYTSLTKASRILGTMAEKDPMGKTAGLVNGTEQYELIQLLSDAFDQKYDVELSAEPWDASHKRLRLQAILELLETVGPGEAPPKVICEALRDAGTITESQMQEILAFQEQKLAMQQQAAAAQAAPPPAQPPVDPNMLQ